jgi:hypothetical protein
MTIKEKAVEFAGKAKTALIYHLIDSTAMLTETTPTFAAYEVFAAGMSPQVSKNTRWIIAGATYGGLGWVYGKVRDISRKVFHINKETKERFKNLHDAVYTSAFNLVLSPPLYYAAGERDIEKIAIGTLCSIGLGLINGGPLGYTVDAFRDLTGLEQSERIPKLISKQSPAIKKSLATILVATSLATTGLIYKTYDAYHNSNHNKTNQVEVQSTK